MSLDTKEFALKAVRLLTEKKAVDVILLEIGTISVIADYFLICHGNSKIQTKALCDHILENLPDEEYNLLRMEGYREASWILLDFGTLVIHIFIPGERSFYNLERLWGGARLIDLQYLSAAP